MPPSVIIPACESKLTLPLAGTTTLNQTSPPEYRAQVGAGAPTEAVALALVNCVKLQVLPTFSKVALLQLSLLGCANKLFPEIRKIAATM